MSTLISLSLKFSYLGEEGSLVLGGFTGLLDRINDPKVAREDFWF
jgi:hypothetical protein